MLIDCKVGLAERFYGVVGAVAIKMREMFSIWWCGFLLTIAADALTNIRKKRLRPRITCFALRLLKAA